MKIIIEGSGGSGDEMRLIFARALAGADISLRIEHSDGSGGGIVVEKRDIEAALRALS